MILTILKSRTLKSVFLTASLVIGLHFVSHAASWEFVNTTNGSINKILFLDSGDQNMLVASDSVPFDFEIGLPYFGYGLRISADGGKTFGSLKLNNYFIFEVFQSPDEPATLYASARLLNRGGLMKSTDNGATWSDDYIGCDGTFQMVAIKKHPVKNLIYIAAANTSNGFLYTIDDFANCRTTSGFNMQARDIAISKADPNLIFICGESGVYRSYDEGQTWIKDVSGLSGLKINCVLPSGTNPALVYCGAEYVEPSSKKIIGRGIYQSLDTGATWKLHAADGYRVYEIIEHPSIPKFLAAACDSLGVLVSANEGYYWENYHDGFTDTSVIQTVAIPNIPPTAEGIIVYAGSANEGIFKSDRLTTTVNDNTIEVSGSIAISGIYPQPFIDNVSVIWNGAIGNQARIQIFDAVGQLVYEKYSDTQQGDMLFVWEPDKSIAAGVYNLRIISGIKTANAKLIYQP
ncbi:MAG: hypothetical protein QG635_1404 [Bacteroidota bacterium]|nr:hypothetical protein [Bacteroidota bacterium]